MRLLTSALVAASMIAFSNGQASAKIIETIVKGTVASGSNSGVFGKRTSFSGQKFVAVYTFNDALGQRSTVSGSSDKLSYQEGQTPGATPLISAYLKIDGHKAYSDGSEYFSDQVTRGAGLQISVGQDTPGVSYFESSIASSNVPDSLDKRFYTAGAPVAGGNQFFFAGDSGFSSGVLDPAFVRETTPAPEPSTWILMILGLGGVGAMLRMAKRKGARDLNPFLLRTQTFRVGA